MMCFADACHALPEPLLVTAESREMKNKKIMHDSLLLRLCYWDICNMCGLQMHNMYCLNKCLLLIVFFHILAQDNARMKVDLPFMSLVLDCIPLFCHKSSSY